MPTPEEQAKIEKERTISDAELLKSGAEYVVNEEGEKRLEVTEEQRKDLTIEQKKLENEKKSLEKKQKIQEILERESHEKLPSINVYILTDSREFDPGPNDNDPYHDSAYSRELRLQWNVEQVCIDLNNPQDLWQLAKRGVSNMIPIDGKIEDSHYYTSIFYFGIPKRTESLNIKSHLVSPDDEPESYQNYFNWIRKEVSRRRERNFIWGREIS